MFTIQIYRNMSSNNTISKDIRPYGQVTGELTAECSILNPTIIIEYPNTDIMKSNYIYIEEFGRYYYITDITTMVNGLYVINCAVDVLMSYKEKIKAQTVIVQKAESAGAYNTYLDDGTFRVYQNAKIATQYFPNGFTNPSFILCVAGSPEVV